LIPSGETSSYRSNPVRLAEFTLSRRVPEYVARAKAAAALEAQRRAGDVPEQLKRILSAVGDAEALARDTQFGSAIFANRPGDGSAREQAASCQRVLGGLANICYAFATKRYRSNCINWGMVPFTLDETTPFPYEDGDCLFVPGIRTAIANAQEQITGQVIRRNGAVEPITLHVTGLTDDERQILLDGCLMNYYANRT
ncbi:MAG: hydratase, partial [Oscillospiraceae bacterium]|nr:hydratase [Oscillospiraceae bacterium]